MDVAVTIAKTRSFLNDPVCRPVLSLDLHCSSPKNPTPFRISAPLFRNMLRSQGRPDLGGTSIYKLRSSHAKSIRRYEGRAAYVYKLCSLLSKNFT